MWFSLFKFGLYLILHVAVPDRPVLKNWIHRWKVIRLLRAIFSFVLYEAVKWVCLVKETFFGWALLYPCCLSFPVQHFFVPRNFTEASHPRLYFASFKNRCFRTGLRTEGCFCKNVTRFRFLSVLNPLLIWTRMRKLYFRAPDSEDRFVPMSIHIGRGSKLSSSTLC